MNQKEIVHTPIEIIYKGVSPMERVALSTIFKDDVLERIIKVVGALSDTEKETALLILCDLYSAPSIPPFSRIDGLCKIKSYQPIKDEITYLVPKALTVEGYFKAGTTVADRINNSYKHLQAAYDDDNKEWKRLPLEGMTTVEKTCTLKKWLECKDKDKDTLYSEQLEEWCDLLHPELNLDQTV